MYCLVANACEPRGVSRLCWRQTAHYPEPQLGVHHRLFHPRMTGLAWTKCVQAAQNQPICDGLTLFSLPVLAAFAMWTKRCRTSRWKRRRTSSKRWLRVAQENGVTQAGQRFLAAGSHEATWRAGVSLYDYEIIRWWTRARKGGLFFLHFFFGRPNRDSDGSTNAGGA